MRCVASCCSISSTWRFRARDPRARVALAVFTLSLIAYLFCQRAELVFLLPRPLALAVLAPCVSSTAWLWLAARSLFDDHFALTPALLGAALGLVIVGLKGNVPRLDAALAGRPDPGITVLGQVHAAAMIGFTAAAVWEVMRGWRDDLVARAAPRAAGRPWASGVYAALALVVELAVRGREVGALLPALHVLGIGSIALALAVLVARHSLVDPRAIVRGRDSAGADADGGPSPQP